VLSLSPRLNHVFAFCSSSPSGCRRQILTGPHASGIAILVLSALKQNAGDPKSPPSGTFAKVVVFFSRSGLAVCLWGFFVTR
jgi:hypothetical protein